MSWKTLLPRIIPVAALVLTLVLAGTAAAQTDPAAPPAPPEQLGASDSREVCVPAGVALTVINQAMALAEVMPRPIAISAGTSPGAVDDPVRLVLPGPARVGACADYEGFWAERSVGSAETALLLYQGPQITDAAAATPVARDGFADTRAGPSRHQQRLRAMVTLSRPGTYEFLAVLSATARKVASNAAQSAMSTDALRMRFVVVIRPRVTPTPLPMGFIEGVVEDIEGRPIAGAAVVARAPVGVDTGRALAPAGALETSGVAVVPAAPAAAGVPAWSVEGSEAGRTGRTDENGRYRLEIPAGRYVVMAQAGGHAPQWFDGRGDPRDADVIEVVAGESRTGVDFVLSLREPTPTPVPLLLGTISGTVRGPDGPIEGASVAARPMRDQNGGAGLGGNAGEVRPVARTDADGAYVLSLTPGMYVVRAEAAGFVAEWYDDARDPADASMVEVVAEQDRPGTDFELELAPEVDPVPPVSPEIAVVAGVVLRGDVPVVGARVYAIPTALLGRDRTVPPGSALPFPTSVPVAPTGRDGKYELHLPPGEYVFAVVESRTSAGLTVEYYDDKVKLEEADLVMLAAGDERTDIDFQLQ